MSNSNTKNVLSALGDSGRTASSDIFDDAVDVARFLLLSSFMMIDAMFCEGITASCTCVTFER